MLIVYHAALMVVLIVNNVIVLLALSFSNTIKLDVQVFYKYILNNISIFKSMI